MGVNFQFIIFLLAIIMLLQIRNHPTIAWKTCTSPNGKIGQCKFVKECRAFLSLNQNDLKPIDQDFLRESRCSPPGSVRLDVCCTDDYAFTQDVLKRRLSNSEAAWRSKPNQAPRVASKPVKLNRSSNRVWGRRPKESKSNKQTVLSQCNDASCLPAPPICGRNNNPRDSIVGGTDAQPNKYPWMALLKYFSWKDSTTVFGCGGSLINQRYVLTAAHCIGKTAVQQLGYLCGTYLGVHDYKDLGQALYVGYEQQIVHESYGFFNKQCDIGLVRLERDIVYSAKVSPICLPSTMSESSGGVSIELATQFTVAGWGKSDSKNSVLQELDVLSVDHAYCEQMYFGMRKFVLNRQSQICAGGVRMQDSCNGDSGGPLMHLRQGSWVEEGLVSFGPKPCGTEGMPGVYTRVAYFDQWIRKNLKP